MRYAVGLRTSHRHHILKNRHLSALVVLGWLAPVLIGLSLIQVAPFDLTQLIVGFWESLLRTSVAYLIAVTLAIILALVVTANAIVEAIFLPILDVFQSFPSFALFPVLVAALKHSPELVIILVLVITILWPILFTIIGAIKNRHEELEEAATIFGARGLKRLWHFTLPELWPAIVTGSIVGWGEGWEFIIGAELLVHVQFGIGRYLGFLGDSRQNTLLGLGVVLLMLALFVVNRVIWLPLLHRATQYQSEA